MVKSVTALARVAVFTMLCDCGGETVVVPGDGAGSTAGGSGAGGAGGSAGGEPVRRTKPYDPCEKHTAAGSKACCADPACAWFNWGCVSESLVCYEREGAFEPEHMLPCPPGYECAVVSGGCQTICKPENDLCAGRYGYCDWIGL